MTSFFQNLTLVFYLFLSQCIAWNNDDEYYEKDYDKHQDCPNGTRVDAMYK